MGRNLHELSPLQRHGRSERVANLIAAVTLEAFQHRIRRHEARQARPGLPVPIAIAVSLGQSEAILLAVARAGLRADLERHQLFGSKADHIPQQISVALLDARQD